MILNLFVAAISFLSLVAGSPLQIPSVGSIAPKIQYLPSDHPIPWVERVKIRAGPYNVPNMMRPVNGTDVHGMLDIPDLDIEKPCKGYCTIVRQWAGLEYPNGTNANVDTGMWLHHMVQFAAGPSRWDPVCYNRSSLPHQAIGQGPETAERYFSSGNERTMFDYNGGGEVMDIGSGYHIMPEDKFMSIVNLMNMNMDDREVYVTMYYDYIDGDLPLNWLPTKVIWLDADACQTSEIRPPQESGDFNIRSLSWTPNFEGRIVDSVGHLHDGGVAVDLMIDDDRLCTLDAAYSETPDYIFTGGYHSDFDRAARDHISSMTLCRESLTDGMDSDHLYLSKDHSLHLVGRYDYSQHAGNVENGRQGALMAISVLIVEVPLENGMDRPLF